MNVKFLLKTTILSFYFLFLSDIASHPLGSTRKSPQFSNMDLDKLFTNPRYTLVGQKIVGFLSYEAIEACREVSPIWKKFIDQQKSWRLNRFLALVNMGWMVQKTEFYDSSVENVDLLEEFPEWKKLIPHVENQMSVSDLDKVINGLERYIALNHDMFAKNSNSGKEVFDEFCPLSFAVHEGDFEFVEVMIRTPFDFNSLDFKLSTCEDVDSSLFDGCRDRCLSEVSQRHRNCETDDEPWRLDDYTHYEGGFNVLHKAINRGHTSIVELILKFADEKNIKIGPSAFDRAKDSPRTVQLLLKHCKYDRKNLCRLNSDTLAGLLVQQADNDEPPKKKKKEEKAYSKDVVGGLLRLVYQGETEFPNKELKNEVVKLAREFQIDVESLN